HRDRLLADGLEGVDHRVVDARGPDAVVVPGVQLLHGDVAALGEVPAGEDLLQLDTRVLGHDLLEALVTVGVGRHAVDPAHVQDVALAAELVGQPLRPQAAVGDLVVGGHIGRRLRDRLVDGDDHDLLLGGLLDHRVELLPVRRVHDDGVGALGDEVLEVLDLLGRAAVLGDGDDLADLAAGQGLGLDRADHLLAPAVAGQGVAHPDDPLLARPPAPTGGRVVVVPAAAGRHGQAHGGGQDADPHPAGTPHACSFLPARTRARRRACSSYAASKRRAGVSCTT